VGRAREQKTTAARRDAMLRSFLFSAPRRDSNARPAV
jgi:hypothetical protein